MTEILLDFRIRRSNIEEVATRLIGALHFPRNTYLYEGYTQAQLTVPQKLRHPDLIYGYHPDNLTFSMGDDWSFMDGSPDFIVQCHARHPDWETTTHYGIKIDSLFVNTESSEDILDKLRKSFRGFRRLLLWFF